MGEVFAIGSALTWAIGIIYLKLASNISHATTLNTLRTLITLIFFTVLLIIKNETFFISLSLESWSFLFLSSFLGIVLGELYFLICLKKIGAGCASIVSSTYAPFVVLLAYFFYNESLSVKILMGGSLIMLAIYLTVSGFKKMSLKDAFIGVSFGALAQFFSALTIMLLKNLMLHHSTEWILWWRFLFATLFLFFFDFFKYGSKPLKALIVNKKFYYAGLLSVLFGSVLSTWLWISGFKHAPSGKAAFLNELGAIFIVLLAKLFLSERMSNRQWIAVALSLMGALLVSI